MTILPVAYLGSVDYFARLLREECTVDTGEHYVKRSERNRARILTAQGVQVLSVHLRHANRPQTPVRDVRIDYSKRWQHLHLAALDAAYRSSPFYEHYRTELEPFYTQRWEFLVDYDLELTALMLRLLGRTDRMPRISESYVAAAEEDLDLRPKRREEPLCGVEPYVQVFADRLPFEPNLSVADLLFAVGPSAAALLTGRRSG